jgi:hypothetical protein
VSERACPEPASSGRDPRGRQEPEARKSEILSGLVRAVYVRGTMFDPGGFAFDLEDDTRPSEDLSDVFSVPGLPALPALKPRFSPGESQRVLHPLWQSQPEPGIVEALQGICESYEPPPVAEVPVTRRSRKRRARG